MDWQVQYLRSVGAPTTASNLKFLNTWQRYEGGHTANSATFNYLNTTWGNKYKAINSVGVRAYPDLQTGADAFAATLNGDRRYSGIVQGLRTGDPYALKDRVAAGLSTWLSGDPTKGLSYAEKVLGGAVTPPPATPAAVPSVAAPTPPSSLIPDTVAMNLTSGLSPRQQLSSLVTAVASQPRVTPQPVPAASAPPASAGTAPSGFVSPVTAAKFGRVDQGVDYSQTAPYRSPGSGVVTRIAANSVKGGSNIGLYVKLDTPITVNGRTYNGIYVWHTNPLVKQGQRVTAGTPLMSGGAAEMGFSDGYKPVAALVGGFGAGTKASQAGQDFLDFVNSIHGRS